MTFRKIDITSTGQIPRITSDYLSGKPELRPFYSLPPAFDSVDKAVEERKKIPVERNLLVRVITEQYSQCGIDLNEHEKVKSAISALQNENAFTVTTGHQLCLFTGPLYFIYKILSAIKLASELNNHCQGRGYHFIPVYWMVSEDHDFLEINHVHVYGKKIEWNPGAVQSACSSGTLRTNGISLVIDELRAVLGNSPGKDETIRLFTEVYSRQTIADATRWLVNRLFGNYGLVIVEGNDARLKKCFTPVMEEDLFRQTPFHLITKTNKELKNMNYEQQINPREINCFYMSPAQRSRIVKEENLYRVLQTDIVFSKLQITQELHDHPERFSPNVALRPLYQEIILPNIAYVGGSNELAYWLQLKSTFDHFKINDPILVLRNSALWIDSFSSGKMNKLNIKPEEIFQPEDALIKKYLHANKDDGTVIQDEKSRIAGAFDSLASKGEAVDKTLRHYIEAEKQKAIKSLESIEEKIFRAEKRKYDTAVEQIKNLKKKLFPPDGIQWQERYENFTPYYMKYGPEWFDMLLERFEACLPDRQGWGGRMNIFMEELP